MTSYRAARCAGLARRRASASVLSLKYASNTRANGMGASAAFLRQNTRQPGSFQARRLRSASGCAASRLGMSRAGRSGLEKNHKDIPVFSGGWLRSSPTVRARPFASRVRGTSLSSTQAAAHAFAMCKPMILWRFTPAADLLEWPQVSIKRGAWWFRGCKPKAPEKDCGGAERAERRCCVAL
jgi:hypothetical protein